MEIIDILFVTEDYDYAKAFTTCVTEENNAVFFTIISSDEFKNYTKINEFDLILIDYMIKNNEQSVLSLSENYQDSLENINQILYRYDSAENFIKQLTVLYCMKTGNKFIRTIKRLSRIILFCSTAGGTGKTSIALGFAQELTRFHGKNVLYINYEEFESTDRYFRRDDKKTLSNYLYYIDTNKNLNGLIDSFTITDEYGIKTFSASKGRNQLKLLNIEELARFLEILQTTANFDYILIDGDDALKEENLWLISICDKICKIDKWENRIKEDNYINYLEHSLGKQIFDKIINVINFFERNEEETIEQDKEKVYIDYDTDSFFNQDKENKLITTINIERDFGIGIRQLTTKLTLNLQ